MNLDVRCQSGIGELRTSLTIKDFSKIVSHSWNFRYYKKDHRNRAYYEL